jgi:hypothetical protein
MTNFLGVFQASFCGCLRCLKKNGTSFAQPSSCHWKQVKRRNTRPKNEPMIQWQNYYWINQLLIYDMHVSLIESTGAKLVFISQAFTSNVANWIFHLASRTALKVAFALYR